MGYRVETIGEISNGTVTWVLAARQDIRQHPDMSQVELEANGLTLDEALASFCLFVRRGDGARIVMESVDGPDNESVIATTQEDV